MSEANQSSPAPRAAVPIALVVATVVWYVLAGVGASALAGLRHDDGRLDYERPFLLDRGPEEALEVRPDRPTNIPFPYADFDLYAEVELPAGGELDLVFRKVLPQTTSAQSFHGRFSLLRLSAATAGPAYRTREQALFGDDVVGGQLVEAGLPATIVVEGRGRRVRANIAGVWHPWFTTTDPQGGFGFVVRGGTGLVHRLQIDPVPSSSDRPGVWWGALSGLLLAFVVWMQRPQPWARAAVAVFALPAVAFLARLLLFSHIVGGALPSAAAVVLAGLSGLPLAIVAAVARRGLVTRLVASLLLIGVVWEGVARLETDRLELLEDPRLDLYFGERSGAAPYDALTRRVRSRAAVHTVDGPPDRVVFVAGGPVFESGEFPAADLGLQRDGEAELPAGRYSHALQTAAAATRLLDRPVDCTIVPCVFGHVRQQVLRFERFFARAFRPRVVVVSLVPWELEVDSRLDLDDVDALGTRDALEPSTVLGSRVLALWSAARAAPQPVADADHVAATFDRLAKVAEREGFAVVLLDVLPLDAVLRDVADSAAREHGFVRASRAAAPDAPLLVDRLARQLVELLRR